MASADFSLVLTALSPVLLDISWQTKETSRNKTHIFRSVGYGFTTSLRLGLGLCLVMQTCPRVSLVSIFCSYPPTFVSDFLHPRPRERKLVFDYLIPPNWLIGDLHSR